MKWLLAASMFATMGVQAASAAAATTPAPLDGAWYAMSTTASGLTGDIVLSDGKLKTRNGAIVLALSPLRLPNFDGQAWIGQIDPSSHRVLLNNNQFCPHKGYPDQGRWIVVSYRPRGGGTDEEITIDAYETWELPVQFGEDKPYYCGGMRYGKYAAGDPKAPRFK